MCRGPAWVTKSSSRLVWDLWQFVSKEIKYLHNKEENFSCGFSKIYSVNVLLHDYHFDRSSNSVYTDTIEVTLWNAILQKNVVLWPPLCPSSPWIRVGEVWIEICSHQVTACQVDGWHYHTTSSMWVFFDAVRVHAGIDRVWHFSNGGLSILRQGVRVIGCALLAVFTFALYLFQVWDIAFPSFGFKNSDFDLLGSFVFVHFLK